MPSIAGYNKGNFQDIVAQFWTMAFQSISWLAETFSTWYKMVFTCLDATHSEISIKLYCGIDSNAWYNTKTSFTERMLPWLRDDLQNVWTISWKLPELLSKMYGLKNIWLVRWQHCCQSCRAWATSSYRWRNTDEDSSLLIFNVFN
jgi:hypothetical protein